LCVQTVQEVTGSHRTLTVSINRFVTCRPVNPCTKSGSVERTELLGKQGSKNTRKNITRSGGRHAWITCFIVNAHRAICY
jgi:hypothetical protein